MIYTYYDQQRSFAEYIDMEFKELRISDDCKYPLCFPYELYDLIIDGYFPDFLSEKEIPRWISDDICGGVYTGVSKRRVKKWCAKLFNEFGEQKKALRIRQKLDLELSLLFEVEGNEFPESIYRAYEL